VYAYDQRGFGETPTRGRWPGADALIDDCADAVAAVRELHPELPLALLGESMGGSVALASLGSGRVSAIDGLILAAPGVRRGVQLHQLHDLALRLGTLALPWLRVELQRGGRPWLDPAESRRLAEDPLILRHLSVGTYDGLIELASRADVVAPARLPPTLLLYGELDGTIMRAGIDQLALRLGGCCTLRTTRSATICCSTRKTQTRCSATAWTGCARPSLPGRASFRPISPPARPSLTRNAPPAVPGAQPPGATGQPDAVGTAGISRPADGRASSCGDQHQTPACRHPHRDPAVDRSISGRADGRLSARTPTPCAWSRRSDRRTRSGTA